MIKRNEYKLISKYFSISKAAVFLLSYSFSPSDLTSNGGNTTSDILILTGKSWEGEIEDRIEKKLF